MGKCQFEITKGKKKGSTCDDYTSKQIDGKFYCSSHYRVLINKKEQLIIEKEPISNQEKEQEPIINKTLENCEDLEEIIDSEYKKTMHKNEVPNEKQIKNCLHKILERLEVIETGIFAKKHRYNKFDEIAECEVFDLV